MGNLFVTKHKGLNVRQLGFIFIKNKYKTDKEYSSADVIKLWNEILTMSEDSIPIIYVKQDYETRKDVVIKGEEFIYLVNNSHNLYVNVSTCEIKETKESEEDLVFDAKILSDYINDYVYKKDKEFETLFNYNERMRELDKDYHNNRTAIKILDEDKSIYCKSYILNLRSMLSVMGDLKIVIIDLY